MPGCWRCPGARPRRPTPAGTPTRPPRHRTPRWQRSVEDARPRFAPERVSTIAASRPLSFLAGTPMRQARVSGQESLVRRSRSPARAGGGPGRSRRVDFPCAAVSRRELLPLRGASYAGKTSPCQRDRRALGSPNVCRRAHAARPHRRIGRHRLGLRPPRARASRRRRRGERAERGRSPRRAPRAAGPAAARAPAPPRCRRGRDLREELG